MAHVIFPLGCATLENAQREWLWHSELIFFGVLIKGEIKRQGHIEWRMCLWSRVLQPLIWRRSFLEHQSSLSPSLCLRPSCLIHTVVLAPSLAWRGPWVCPRKGCFVWPQLSSLCVWSSVSHPKGCFCGLTGYQQGRQTRLGCMTLILQQQTWAHGTWTGSKMVSRRCKAPCGLVRAIHCPFCHILSTRAVTRPVQIPGAEEQTLPPDGGSFRVIW